MGKRWYDPVLGNLLSRTNAQAKHTAPDLPESSTDIQTSELPPGTVSPPGSTASAVTAMSSARPGASLALPLPGWVHRPRPARRFSHTSHREGLQRAVITVNTADSQSCSHRAL